MLVVRKHVHRKQRIMFAQKERAEPPLQKKKTSHIFCFFQVDTLGDLMRKKCFFWKEEYLSFHMIVDVMLWALPIGKLNFKSLIKKNKICTLNTKHPLVVIWHGCFVSHHNQKQTKRGWGRRKEEWVVCLDCFLWGKIKKKNIPKKKRRRRRRRRRRTMEAIYVTNIKTNLFCEWFLQQWSNSFFFNFWRKKTVWGYFLFISFLFGVEKV